MSLFLMGSSDHRQTQTSVSRCTQTVSAAAADNCSSHPNAVLSKSNPPGTTESTTGSYWAHSVYVRAVFFPHIKTARPVFGYLLQQSTAVCLCKHLKRQMNLTPRIFHFIPLSIFLRVSAVFRASKQELKVRRLFFCCCRPGLVLRLPCLTRAVFTHPLPVCISDSLPGNSKAAIRSCRSHHCGSTDTGHLASANPD